MNKLKPCPFCGGQVAYSRYSISGEGRIKCPTCQTMLVFLSMDKPAACSMEQCKEETIQCWNKRKCEDETKELQTEILELNQIRLNLYNALSTYMDEDDIADDMSVVPQLANALQELLWWVTKLSDHVSRRDRMLLGQLHNLENPEVDEAPACQRARELLTRLEMSGQPETRGDNSTLAAPKILEALEAIQHRAEYMLEATDSFVDSANWEKVRGKAAAAMAAVKGESDETELV